VKFASSKAVSLILLGTSGRRHAARFLLGSVAEEVFRQVSCPVVVLGPKARLLTTAKSILLVFATDLEPHSLATLSQLSKIASRLHAKVSVIRCVSRGVRSTQERTELRKETERAFRAVANRSICARTQNINLVFAPPVKAITTFASRVGADAVVMGIRSGAGLTRATTHIPWTIAHRVIASAKCPVITLRG
jgi:nucleotide-binding universal stress UspA family protein